MLKVHWKLLLICLAALALRLLLLTFIEHPGIGDPNHYYNLGLRLIGGHGFTIDYIWQYNLPPENIVHPIDHWLPLTGLLAAVGMLMGGQTVAASVLPFIVMGVALCVLGYAAARQFGCSRNASLFVAACTGFLPEFVLNSLRTDTTILNALFVTGSILLLTHGLQIGRVWPFIVSGVLAGLAYWTRNDATLMIPLALLVAGLYSITRQWRSAAYALLVPVVMLLVVAPWLIRNMNELGVITTPETSRMMFFTDQRDHYAYMRTFSLETMLAERTPMQLIGKRLFELLAGLKVSYTTLDIFLPVAVIGGFVLILQTHDRQRLRVLLPTLIWIMGALLAYTILVPYKGQSGSFKKAYLTIVPLLLPLAGYALDRAITETRLRVGTMILICGFLTLNAIELVRADANTLHNYLQYIHTTVEKARTLPDTNGDGEIILMAQDPFMLRFFGMRSVMMPMESREKVLEVAERYRVDYMMMPPDRPSLDPLYSGTDTDPRFPYRADIPGTNVQLFGFDFDTAS